MNYKGRVTALNTTTWTLQLDHKVTVHMGHIAQSSCVKELPEIGEFIKIYKAHFMIGPTNKLNKLFLCDKSRIVCENSTSIHENGLLTLIDKHNLGSFDLHSIDSNFVIIHDYIKNLSSNLSEEIMWNIVAVLADSSKNTNVHRCLNNVLSSFRLQTVSHYNLVDLYPNKNEKMPIWFFGSHSKDKPDKLLGFLQINKRYGVWLLKDVNRSMPCVVVNNNCTDMYNIVNKFVLIHNFRIFTEVYKENDVPGLEYILFNLQDVTVLQNIQHSNVDTMQYSLTEQLPEHFPYIYKFKFKLLKKATVHVDKNSQIGCWLEVFLIDEMRFMYLALNVYQVQITPLLKEGHIYEVYHSEKLVKCTCIELQRIKRQDLKMFCEKNVHFVHISKELDEKVLNVNDLLENTHSDVVSVQGLVSLKKLTPCLSSRTQKNSSFKEFGTPGTSTHAVILENDQRDKSIVLYLNNWENLQMPLGLIPGMRICVRNAFFKKYLKSNALTTFEVLNYEPSVLFDTVNLCETPDHVCDKYSYLGWGNLLPCNVLIWARVSELFIRSLKIWYRCIDCMYECNCESGFIEVTITFYVHDEFGAALVLSKNVELLRLLLGLELTQWKVWCSAFERVKEFIFDSNYTSTMNLHINAFCEALTLAVETINVFRVSNLELKCRKMEDNPNNDNNGMALWYCSEARKNECKT
ncbi:hypothetical protein FQA39_LY01336 [Lamprigera yunnana]|nr:hypothetical protein FQA39_LY01336 [Lamprigera yunnana]